MRKNKKLIIIAVVVGIVLVGSLAGAAFAQTASTDGNSGKTLLARVAAILGIEQQKVEDAFTQAQKEMQNEALDSYLKKLVESGKLTQEQADQYKTWMQSRPDVPLGPGFKMHGRFPGMGGFSGFRWGPGFDRLPASPNTTQ